MEVIINHLPGTPDGVTRAPDGNFWTALLVSPPKATQVCGHSALLLGGCSSQQVPTTRLSVSQLCGLLEAESMSAGLLHVNLWLPDCKDGRAGGGEKEG